MGVSVACAGLTGHRLNSQSVDMQHIKKSDLLSEVGGWTPDHDLGPCFHYKQKALARKTRFGQENLGLVCL